MKHSNPNTLTSRATPPGKRSFRNETAATGTGGSAVGDKSPAKAVQVVRRGANRSKALLVAEPRVDTMRGIRSTLTRKSQTTVPRGVRNALHIGPGDELLYEIRGDEAVIRRAVPMDTAAEDPVLLGFLDLLERDLAAHPGRVQSLPASLLRRMREVAAATGLLKHDDRIDGPVAI